MLGQQENCQNEEKFIPIIDFYNFINGNELEKKDVALQVLSAFQKCGFLYLKNHGIDEIQIETMFQNSKLFFDQPEEDKLKLAWENPESNRGYAAIGREKLTEKDKEGKINEIKELHNTQPDQKESFQIGSKGGKYRNLFPKINFFEKNTLDFYDCMHELNLRLMECISIGLNLDSQHLSKLCIKAENTLRLLHYPAMTKLKSQLRAGAHCDYGTITILFQDNNGGLQVKNLQTGLFQDASPIDKTCIINVGDMLQRISNDMFQSTLHQVVSIPQQNISDECPPRYSIVYFCNTDFDVDLECLPNCYNEKNPIKYQKINTLDYLISRIKATYF